MIDRFCFCLDTRVLNIKQRQEDEPARLLMNSGWVQCHYQWRYKVFEGGFYYWLYEAVTLNACFTQCVDEYVFLKTEPVRRFVLFLESQQSPG